MKSQSGHNPGIMVKSNGKTQVNYNIISKEVTDEYGTRTIWEYDYVEVEGKVTRQKVINAINNINEDSEQEIVTPDDIYLETEQTKINKKAIKTAYLEYITTLASIQNVVNPTNAQVVAAIKAEANILEKLLKFMKSQII